MKKIIIILIPLISILFVGCSNLAKENSFTKKVEVLKVNEIKLKTLEISFNDFQKNIQDIFTKEYEKSYINKIGEQVLLKTNGQIIHIKDLESIDFEKINEYKKEINKFNKKIGYENIDILIDISNESYDGTFDNTKRVYTKTTQSLYFKDKKTPFKTLTYNAYDFENDSRDWKISQIKKTSIRTNNFNKKELNDILSRTAFTKENNNNIEYIKSLNLSIDISK